MLTLVSSKLMDHLRSMIIVNRKENYMLIALKRISIKQTIDFIKKWIIWKTLKRVKDIRLINWFKDKNNSISKNKC